METFEMKCHLKTQENLMPLCRVLMNYMRMGTYEDMPSYLVFRK